ncbi:TIM barrel protein [uncultured Sphingomonas sp.]|uniref:hydroxypyruvate isomerase family protein n=1 Tax=uncultured Sphingomonas sp. TaxID=158754 RepID=UPI0025E73A26|nr:TIM barrel protein [uncultured Sphingomonas sp.]
MSVSRRTVMGGLAAAVPTAALAEQKAGGPSNAARFSLGFAPHLGSFASRGATSVEQIAFAADQGFWAWEDNEYALRPVAEQEAIAKALRQRGMTMGVFVASMPKWSESRPLLGGEDDGERQAFLADVRNAVEVAKRANAKWATVVTGFMDRKLHPSIQQGRIIDVMRRAAEIVAPHGLTLVMEPLNTRTNHPGVFMQSIAEGYAVARGVNSPGVKVLADLYHEQIQSGNLIPTLNLCWDEIGYIQFGDNPGRNEPGSGEVNYANVCRVLKQRGYMGVIGMEHGNSVKGRAGEERLIAAYRAIDPSI